MTLEQLAKQGRRKEILTTAFTINDRISEARNENLKRSFVDCEHIKNRNEFVGMRNGVKYINDSAARSLSATWFSMENITEPIVWITMLGSDDYEEMIPVVRQHVKAIICIGDNAEPINEALGYLVRNDISCVGSLEEAMELASEKSISGCNVLFSPGCPLSETSVNKMGRVFVKMAKEN